MKSFWIKVLWLLAAVLLGVGVVLTVDTVTRRPPAPVTPLGGDLTPIVKELKRIGDALERLAAEEERQSRRLEAR